LSVKITSDMDKNQVLRDLADLIRENESEIIRYNQRDMDAAKSIDDTLQDRLKVDAKKVQGMVSAVENIISMEDPVGKVLSHYQHPNGMVVENRVVPMGKILIIYESRPDVTIEAAITAFKAGNRILLKGGKEARRTNLFLVELWHRALDKNDVPTDWVTYLDMGREEMQHLIKNNTHKADIIIPRGGEGLIQFIRTHSSVPLIISGRGNNFVYIHADADFDMATQIILNGKSRLSVCNATDKVLINAAMPDLDARLQQLIDELKEAGLTVLADARIASLRKNVKLIESDDIFYEEFLSPKILLALVDTPDEAIGMINEYSGGHTAVIVSADNELAAKFQLEVDCAAVGHNVSSRFTDGGEFGVGAEIAISTQKLHFRGPLGSSELVTNKWFVNGNGQIR